VTFVSADLMLCVISGLKSPVGVRAKAWLATPHGSYQRLSGMRLQLRAQTISTSDILLALRPAHRREALERDGSLIVSTREIAVALQPADLAEVTSPLSDFAEERLRPLDRRHRDQLLERVRSMCLNGNHAASAAATHLVALRDAVRDPLPGADMAPGAVFAAHVDGIWRIDGSRFYVEGWVFDRAAGVRRLTLISPEGQSTDITSWMFRYRRSDVSDYFSVRATDRLGFVAYIELPRPSPFGAGWILEAELADGGGAEFRLPDVRDEPLHLRSTLLGDLELQSPPPAELLSRHISPAISQLQKRLVGRVAIEDLDQHGEPPVAPEVSIVVPLFKRVDFLEHQLAQFALDSEFGRVDLVYLLDSPEDALLLRPLAAQLYDLHRVPFRLATLNSNGGYSVVNNLGASLARGRLLLLLNSDVLPRHPGWLSEMTTFYDATPGIGVLGPKLLYEDDSIQHAGVYFDRGPSESTWANEHFYKGFHRLFGPANVARAVPAVTGACLMIETELYNRAGGLSGAYIRGDYEDTDLCLRLAEKGLTCWYLPQVELYHLEGQSYADADRERASQYNRWLHSHLWCEQLTRQERGVA
jgi:GT2 family glycosyltransferase